MNEANLHRIVVCDTEFRPQIGQDQVVVCLVAKRLSSNSTIRIFGEELNNLRNKNLFAADEILVAFAATAELSSLLAIGANLPGAVLDLHLEFRNLTNSNMSKSYSLLSALDYFGLPAMAESEKTAMRDLILKSAEYSHSEQIAILDYCEADVLATEQLFFKMLPLLDWDRALFRGEHARSCSIIERNGIPVDVERAQILQNSRITIRNKLIEEIDANFGFYEDHKFKVKNFAKYISEKGWSWFTTDRGQLKTDCETLKQMSRVHPELELFKELRAFLGSTKDANLPIGLDGRNRTQIRPFASTTGRNQPSSTQFIFGHPSWERGLIKPEPGCALAYIDYSQQEVAIAASLSADKMMQQAYTSGDCYLEFGKQAGVIPQSATKKSHPREREKFKQCVLAVQYGMGPESLAKTAKLSEFESRKLLEIHRDVYKAYWNWSDQVVDAFCLAGRIQTRFGWTLHYTKNFNERSVRNFPMQANGAEILRVALRMLIQAKIKVCAPIHDAVLIEGSLEGFDARVVAAQQIMQKAGEIVLDGFKLRTDAKIITYPERYMDERGAKMWETVNRLVLEHQSP